MCGWAILQSRIKNLYFGSYDSKYGAFSSVNLNKFSDFKTNIYGGIKEEECNDLLKSFFKKIR
jgi:tRNA(adenine34) deaminase